MSSPAAIEHTEEWVMNTPDTEEQRENREPGENRPIPTPAPEPIPEPTYAPEPMPEPMASSEPITIPARMLNEFAYCPRLCYLEWVQGEFEDSHDTVEGRMSTEGWIGPKEHWTPHPRGQRNR